MKPPKNDEWEFKDSGLFTISKASLAHKVDSISLDVIVDTPDAQNGLAGGSFSEKQFAEDSWKGFSTHPDFKETAKKALRQTKLPGNGAGGQTCWLLEFTAKDKNDKSLEFSMYFLQAKESKSVYRLSIIGEPGLYKKHQKVIDYAFTTFRTYKLPK
jgi:hypothetical protein